MTRKFCSSIHTAIGQVHATFYLLFGYLRAIFGPLLWGQPHSTKVNHRALVNFWLEGYLMACNKQYLIPIPKPDWAPIGVWNQNLLIQLQHFTKIVKHLLQDSFTFVKFIPFSENAVISRYFWVRHRQKCPFLKIPGAAFKF